jgi:hypothetical protein
MPIFLGKEHIGMKNHNSFLELPYVKKALNSLPTENPFVFNCVHGDHVEDLPRDLLDFTHHGSSERTPHEIWTSGTTILSM